MLSRVPSSAARRRGLSMPALGGSGILPPLGLAPAAVAAQSLVAVGVARGVCVSGGLSRRCRGSSGRALVALAGRFGVVVWRSALARSGVGAFVFRCGRGRRVPFGLGGGGVRGGLVGLGRVPAGGSPVRGSGLGCLRSGGRPLRCCPLPSRGLAASAAAAFRFGRQRRRVSLALAGARLPPRPGGALSARLAGLPAPARPGRASFAAQGRLF